jgi:hypothetical protein
MSAYLAVDGREIDALCQTHLERFSTVAVFERSALTDAAIEVVPTFRRPHVTLAQINLKMLVNGPAPVRTYTP